MIEFTEYLVHRASSGTVTLYVRWMLSYLDWLNGRKHTQESAQEYLDSLHARGLKPNTISVAANAIRAWSKWQGQNIELDSPKVHMEEPKYLSEDEILELVDACQTPLEYVLIVVLFDTACRISELLGIEVDDIDWPGSMIRVRRKGGATERVNLSEKGLAALRSWMNVRKYAGKKVFMDLTYHQAWSLIKGVGKRIGVNLRPHMLRHSRAVQMLERGAEIYHVQGHLGHKNINTTMDVYGRLKPVHLKEHIPEW